MSEYIGSRISLISKSDIKYIGTLHEINSETHTVALESVTSFGTEGRRGNPADEIPGSDQVYEYIVFRGSDVKELKIVAPPTEPKENERPNMPNDPAILGSARPAPQSQPPPPSPYDQNQFRGPQPPQQPHPHYGYQGPPPNQFQNQPRFQGPGGPHGFPGAPGAVPAYGYGPPGPPPPPGYGMPYGPPPGQGFPPQGAFSPGPQMPYGGPPSQQMHEMPGSSQPAAGSNRATPQPAGQPSQSAAPQSKPAEKSTTAPADAAPAQKPAVAAPQAQQAPPKAAQRAGPRVAIPLPSPNVLAAKPPQRSAAAQAPAASAAGAKPQSEEDATQVAAAAVAAAMAKLGNSNQRRPQADVVENLGQKVNNLRVADSQQYRGRGRGRGGPTAWGGRREGVQPAVEVPKEDFDFASANAKFNKQDLIKEAIASGEPITSPEVEKAADPIADTNGHGNGDAAEDVVIPPPKVEKGYNKKSSFFDDISSDLKDRVVQAQQQITVDGRAIRREERTKNVETFGQGSVDTGARGGYRGRGRGGRNFGRGGGVGGGYRGRGGYEGRGAPEGSRGGFRGRSRVEADAI